MSLVMLVFVLYVSNVIIIKKRNKKESSNLVTIVSRTLQSQDGRIGCPVDRHLFFLASHTVFVQFWTMCRSL